VADDGRGPGRRPIAAARPTTDQRRMRMTSKVFWLGVALVAAMVNCSPPQNDTGAGGGGGSSGTSGRSSRDGGLLTGEAALFAQATSDFDAKRYPVARSEFKDLLNKYPNGSYADQA